MIIKKNSSFIILASLKLILLIVIIQSVGLATAEQSIPYTITETQITKSESAFNPAIYGDRISWTDCRNGSYDIFMYDLCTKEETQISTSGSAEGSAIYGDRIVWKDGRNGKSDIYMYNVSTKKEIQISTSGYASYPSIYGDKVVWSSNHNIYVYDLSTKKETQLTNDQKDKGWPVISGNKIVWVETPYSRNNSEFPYLYVYDLCTKKVTQRINTGSEIFGSFDFYGNKLVWSGGTSGTCIYMYDLSTNKKTQISTCGYDPAIYCNKVVWENLCIGNIYIYNICTKKGISQIVTSAIAFNPAIYGDKIVWMDTGNMRFDIYMATVGEK
jgi:beta propeller repeat protein